MLSTVCKPARGGLLGQLFRHIGIGVGNKGSGQGGGQLPLGPLHYLVLSRKKQLELSKDSHWHGVPIPLVILNGFRQHCPSDMEVSELDESRCWHLLPTWRQLHRLGHSELPSLTRRYGKTNSRRRSKKLENRHYQEAKTQHSPSRRPGTSL